MDQQLTAEILDLRAKKLTPKQIARKLNLKTAEVVAVLQSTEESGGSQRQPLAAQSPLHSCWINSDFKRSFIPAHKLLPEKAGQLQRVPIRHGTGPGQAPNENGLVTIVVLRHTTGHKLKLASYLVDYNCLGVKDALPPKTVDKAQVDPILEKIYSGYPFGRHHISLNEAHAVIFSALEFAHRCGLEPHPDFDRAKDFLGPWDRSLYIECGQKGQPWYCNGPFESKERIAQVLSTLERTVGPNNFHFTVVDNA